MSTGQIPPWPLPPSKTQVLVHRAAADGQAENSLAGLRACAEREFEWAEIDVRRTSDGVHVLMHDETIDRTTTGNGAVSALTRAELNRYALRQAAEPDQAARVPGLVDALRLADGRIGLYLDGRDVDEDQLAGELAPIDGRMELIVCLGSSLAATWRRLNRTIPLAVYCESWTAAVARNVELLAPAFVEVPGGRLDAAIMRGAADAGAAVICLALGDADKPEIWGRAIDLGAGWIMTDRAREVSAVLAGRYT